MNVKKLLYIFLIVFCWGCKHNTESSKYQNQRNNVSNIQDKIKEIKIEQVLIGNNSRLYTIGEYLIITDYDSADKLIHLFNRNNFNYITSIVNRGLGPNEITNVGEIGINETDRKFYVSDHGKQKIYCFNLDSVLINTYYFPKEEIAMNQNQFPSNYQYYNDTLSLGLFISPIGNADYKPTVGKWNMNTGEIKLMKYEHPEIEKKRVNSTASIEHGVYVECYWHHDLITICGLNGDLKYNIYGKRWDNKKSNRINFFREVAFCNDKIIALYCDGENNFIEDKNGRLRPNFPSKFIVLDINGDYIQTLETGYNIKTFCFDKYNNRIIISLDDEIQFAYLDLDGII